MSTKKAFLLLNGNPPKELPDLSSYDIVCATDGAYSFLNKHQVKPNFISGDFDSLQTLPKDIDVIHTPNQNYTDFDKALKILKEKQIKTVHIYGASGQEQDHFLGNLHTAVQWKNSLKLTFFDEFSRYFLANKKTTFKECNHKMVSLIPFPKATGITTKGLQYPLTNETLTIGTRIGTRNKAVNDEVKIVFETGNLCIFIHH